MATSSIKFQTLTCRLKAVSLVKNIEHRMKIDQQFAQLCNACIRAWHAKPASKPKHHCFRSHIASH